MAIPLSMPNSDDIDDGHRLDLLLEQLLITLRQVLIHRRRAAAAAAAAVSRTAATTSRHRHEAVARTRTEEEVGGIQETRVVPTEEDDEVVGEEETTTTTTGAQFPLPDLVMGSSSTTSTGKERARTCYGEHRVQCYHHHHHHNHHHAGLHSGAPTSWVDDGGQLIRLAGQLLHQVRTATKEP